MLYNFIFKNILIVTLLILSIVILLIIEIKLFFDSKNSITINEVLNLINNNTGIIIDIRDINQFNTSHILSSINIPYNKIVNNLNLIKKHKNKVIIILAETDSEAQKCIQIIKKNSLCNVRYIANGIKSWKKNDMPTISIK